MAVLKIHTCLNFNWKSRALVKSCRGLRSSYPVTGECAVNGKGKYFSKLYPN